MLQKNMYTTIFRLYSLFRGFMENYIFLLLGFRFVLFWLGFGVNSVDLVLGSNPGEPWLTADDDISILIDLGIDKFDVLFSDSAEVGFTNGGISYKKYVEVQGLKYRNIW